MILFLLGFISGGICGIVAICLVAAGKVIQADDPHRHAAAERLNVPPDDLRDTPDGYVPIPGARPQVGLHLDDPCDVPPDGPEGPWNDLCRSFGNPCPDGDGVRNCKCALPADEAEG